MMISWSGGVNSTAIIALHLLGRLKGRPEIVFADTGCELPETYEYIDRVSKYLQRTGWQITRLSPFTHPEIYPKSVHSDLYAWLWDKKTIPGRSWKRCNSDFKRNPLKRYAKGRIQMIGICRDEPRRFKDFKDIQYPVDIFTRAECHNLIKEAGLPPAHKTSCFFCPLQSKGQWINLYRNHPALWQNAVALERRSRYTFLKNYTLEAQMRKWGP